MKNLGFLILMVLVLIGCDDDDLPEDCLTPATIRNLAGLDGCGWVFELQDGTRLEPLRVFYCGTPPLPKEMTEDPLDNFEFIDNKKVLINYELVENGASICMVGPVVKITCITEATVNAEN
jgi:hypothetical protein